MSAPAGERVPITRLSLGEEEVAAVTRVIRSGWVTQGPEVAAFENEFAQVVGAPHAVAVSNCTVALELALRGVGVGPGDEVATVSHSFIATANAVLSVGARPLFVDVEAATFGMDPGRLEKVLGPRTKAILCVHQLGFPCDVAAILAVAAQRGVPVVEDAACAIGSEVLVGGRWEQIGRPHGVVACFSFHPRKVVTTGDGGMLTTTDPELARRLRLLRQHGMSVPDSVRHGAAEVVFEEYVEPAWNYRMTDIQAAVGRPQLARLATIVDERRVQAERYREALSSNKALAPFVPRADARPNWQSYPAVLRDEFAGLQRRAMQLLLDRGIATRRGVMNAHQEPAYASPGRWSCGDTLHDHASGRCLRLAVSEMLRDRTILLPIFPSLSEPEQRRVIDACAELPRLLRGSS